MGSLYLFLKETIYSGHSIVVVTFIAFNLFFAWYVWRQKTKFVKQTKEDLRNSLLLFNEINLQEKGTKKVKQVIDDLFLKNQKLHNLWKKYSATLVYINQTDQEPLYATTDADVFFNIDNFIERSKLNVSLQLWNLAPQILTSIGIIGTFASILSSLASLGGSTIINEAFIIKLVNSLAIGFISSLIGVVLASLFAYSEKRDLKEISDSLLEINSIIDDKFTTINSEGILASQVHVLNNLSSNISTSISEGFETMSGGLGDALADVMDDKTKETIKSGVAESFATMNLILREIKEESEKLKVELIALKDSKKDVLDTIKLITEDQNLIRKDQEKIQSDINVQSNKLKENLESFEKIIAPLSEVAKQVKETNELSGRLIEAVSNVKDASSSIKSSAEALKENNENVLIKYEEQIEKINKGYGGLGQGISDWVTETNKSIEKNLGTFDEKIGNVLNKVGLVATNLNTSVINLEKINKKKNEEVKPEEVKPEEVKPEDGEEK